MKLIEQLTLPNSEISPSVFGDRDRVFLFSDETPRYWTSVPVGGFVACSMHVAWVLFRIRVTIICFINLINVKRIVNSAS
jgi:hypothetical protein